MNSEKLISMIAANSTVSEEPEDFVKDGLLYCGHCETPKQCRIKFSFGERVVGCQCACAQRKWEAEQKAEADRQRAIYIKNLRVTGVRDKGLANCRFENAEESRELTKCKRYVENWREARESNIGLLLWGNTGGGKSYAAACIVNALIDKGVPAMITSFPRILNSGWDKSEIAEQMRYYELVVIDDLGAERGNDIALEAVYMVIDERYKAKKPLIITTNMTMDEMCNPQNMNYQRIYDRVLEMCTPMEFSGESRRWKKSDEKTQKARKLLGG